MLTNFTSLKFVLVVLIISISVPGHNIAQEHFHYMPSKIGWYVGMKPFMTAMKRIPNLFHGLPGMTHWNER